MLAGMHRAQARPLPARGRHEAQNGFRDMKRCTLLPEVTRPGQGGWLPPCPFSSPGLAKPAQLASVSSQRGKHGDGEQRGRKSKHFLGGQARLGLSATGFTHSPTERVWAEGTRASAGEGWGFPHCVLESPQTHLSLQPQPALLAGASAPPTTHAPPTAHAPA